MNKTVQQIECRDDIWKRVEALAQRRGVSTDEIVQAALIQLFTKKKEAPASSDAHTPAPAVRPSPPPSARPSGPPTPSSSAAASRPLPRPAGAPPGPPAGSPSPSGRLPPPSPRAATPAPTPAPRPAPVAPVEEEVEAEIEAVDRPLYLFFEGNWYTVDQEQYVIGRGSKFSDLPIKDANISRRHCAIMRRDGEYYMTDLGSTNGIEFAGVRVDNHMVEEGNVYYLCDHEIRFSFQAPY